MVVVLIIGILASVALPQYTKSVEKSRAAEALLTLKAINDAQRIFMLENGGETGATTFDALSYEIPGTTDASNPRIRETKTFRYHLSNLNSAAPNNLAGSTNYAYRLPIGTSYAFLRINDKTFCCWFKETHRQTCVSLGFTIITDEGWIVPAVGCAKDK